MKNRLLTFFVLIAVCFAGCLSPRQDYNALKSTFAPPAAEAGRIFFYRDAVFSPAKKPAVLLDGQEVGLAKALSFFYVDRPAGSYSAAVSGGTRAPVAVTVTAGQTAYVRINLHSTLTTSEFYPTVVDAATAQREMGLCKPAGSLK